MIPFKSKMARLVEQLAPNLPGGQLTDVLRNAVGLGAAPTAPDSPLPCFARPGVMPDLSALLGRRRGPRARAPGAPAAEPVAGRFTKHQAATAAGTYDYNLYEPDGTTRPTALVVMLHGCTQDAADFAAGTRMNALAQRHNILVAYPEQMKGANLQRCWNWFLQSNQRRDQGEAAAIATITREVMARHAIAPGRVFVAGLSAGGAMAAIVAEAYPEIFGAAGIHSGLPVGAAHDVASAFAAMRQGGMGRGTETGPLSRHVPTIVFHGDADMTVNPQNAAAILARITARNTGLTTSTERGAAAEGRGFLKTTGRDAGGRVVFESWTVEGAGHAWSGGSTAGSYTDPRGPDASAAMMNFFLRQIGETVERIAA